MTNPNIDIDDLRIVVRRKSAQLMDSVMMQTYGYQKLFLSSAGRYFWFRWAGYKPLGDDGGIRWLVLLPDETACMSDLDLISNLGWVPYYRGPGYEFARRAFVRRTNTRVLVTQFVGRDV